VEADFGYSPSPELGFQATLGLNQLATRRFYAARVGSFDVTAQYRLMPFDAFTPIISAGLGVISGAQRERFDFSNGVFPKLQAGLGFEYALRKNLSLKASLHHHYILSDQLDFVTQGKYNDFYWNGRIGLNLYFGGEVSSKRAFNFDAETDEDF